MTDGGEGVLLPEVLLAEAASAGVGVALVHGAELTYVYADERFLGLAPDVRIVGRTYAEVWPELLDAAGMPVSLTVSPLQHDGDLYGLVRADARSLSAERRGEPAGPDLLAEELARARRLTERSAVLREIAGAATNTMELRSLAEQVLGIFERRLGASRGVAFLVDSDILRKLASFGMQPAAHHPQLLDEESLFGQAMRLGRHITHEDVLPEPAAVKRDAMGLEEERWIVLPIVSKGVVLAGLSLAFGERRPFTEEEINLYDGIAQQLGGAIEKILLFEELRETTRLSDALNDINEALHGSMERHELLRRSVSLADEVLACDMCAAFELVGDQLVPVAERELPRPLASTQDLSAGRLPCAHWVFKQNEVLSVDDVMRDRRVDGEWLRESGIASLIVLPLKLRRRSFGVLFFGFSEPHAFTDAEVDFAQKLASAVSLALESARMYENERFIAETLQESLLSLPDEVEGLEIAHLYSSATDTARVGGDFYDVFELAHGNVGVLIGDVSGKGVDAAVLTSLVKNTLRAHSVTPGRTPAQIVQLTSDAVYRETMPESFVTLLFGILDRRDGRFVYCNAAHTSGCLRRTDGTSHALPGNSPIVGAFPDTPFAESEVYLDYGDELWLYTDGLTEARSGSVQFGEERLMDTLAESQGTSLDRRLGDLLGEVVRFSEGRLNDDIALLVIRRTGQPDAAVQQKFDYRQLWG